VRENGVRGGYWDGHRGTSELVDLIANPGDPHAEQDEHEGDPTAVPGEQRIRIVCDNRPGYTAPRASPRLLAYQLVALPAHPMPHAASPVLGSLGCVRLTYRASAAATPHLLWVF
jgi:hypothetical protein